MEESITAPSTMHHALAAQDTFKVAPEAGPTKPPKQPPPDKGTAKTKKELAELKKKV